MTVFLTGATGFVGSYLLPALVKAGHAVRCLVRDPDAPLAIDSPDVTRVAGDVTDANSLDGACDGCEAVVHLVGIIDEAPAQGVTFEAIHRDGTRHVVAEARRAGVETFVHMSANGADPDGPSRYQTTKHEAEEVVRHAGFARWTIIRPSIIFGDPGPGGVEFTTRLAETLIRPFPVLPVFGDGRYPLQPVHVTEVADAFVQALTNEAADGATVVAVGPEAFPYVAVLNRITRACGLAAKPKIFIPEAIARPVVHLLGPLGLLPISPAQFEMLLAGNAGDPSGFYATFDLTRVPFNEANLAYLRK
jgi:NADH dehydrogenase